MSLKKHEIEALIEHATDDIVSQVFENQFSKIEDIEFALEFLKSKINELEIEDFEDCIVD
jgi:hypothetical protein